MKHLLIILLLVITIPGIGQQITSQIFFQERTNTSTIEERALEFYTIQIENNPSNVQAYVLRSEINRSLGRHNDAEDDMRKALSINPFARIYKSKEERIQLFPIKSFSYLTSNNTNPQYFKKQYLLEDQYKSILNENNLLDSEMNSLKDALMSIIERDFDEAYLYLGKLKPETLNTAIYNDIRGVLELERGEIDKAIGFFTLAIRENPYFVIPYYNRAVAYKRLGMLDKSEADFYSALSINAEIAQIHFSKGKLLELKNDIDGASYYYKNALKLKNNYAEAATNYSVLLKNSGEYTHAMIEIEDAINGSPDNSNNYYVRGGLNFIFGEYTLAISDFDKYLNEYSEDNDALFFRGLCKVLSNDPIDGCRDLRESIRNGYNTANLEMVNYMCN